MPKHYTKDRKLTKFGRTKKARMTRAKLRRAAKGRKKTKSGRFK